MTLPSDPAATLVGALLRGTRAGDVKWVAAEDVADTFVLKGEAGTIRLRNDGIDGLHPVTFTMLNEVGDAVEQFTSDPQRPGPWLVWESQLGDLFEQARDSARGTTDLVQKLMNEFRLPPPRPSSDDDVPY